MKFSQEVKDYIFRNGESEKPTLQEQPVCENPRPTSAPKTFRYNDRKYHIVTSFEDNGEIYYVVKYFGRYKQWWHYEVLSSFELALQTK